MVPGEVDDAATGGILPEQGRVVQNQQSVNILATQTDEHLVDVLFSPAHGAHQDNAQSCNGRAQDGRVVVPGRIIGVQQGSDALRVRSHLLQQLQAFLVYLGSFKREPCDIPQRARQVPCQRQQNV